MDAINKAQCYVNDVVNNNVVVIDLEQGLQCADNTVVFGLCNIIYQQVFTQLRYIIHRHSYFEGIQI